MPSLQLECDVLNVAGGTGRAINIRLVDAQKAALRNDVSVRIAILWLKKGAKQYRYVAQVPLVGAANYSRDQESRAGFGRIEAALKREEQALAEYAKRFPHAARIIGNS